MRRLLQLLTSLRAGLRPPGAPLRSWLKGLAPVATSGGLLFIGSFAFDRYNFKSLILEQRRVAAAERPYVPSNVNFIADVVEKVLPAVVYIETGRHFGVRTSSGSGFIFREDGYVLTNFHVVGSNSSVKVRLSDDRVLEGRVIAANPNLDLALVKLAATGLPSISLARSADLRTGEWVVALGAPRFLTNSVTVGVVSATDRDLGIHRGKRYIQTDAAITHGNSGGPLVNVEGQVVGINTLKLEAGIGFAIPADDISGFVSSALDTQSGSFRSSGFFDPSRKAGDKRQAYIGINMMTLQYHILDDLRRMMPGYFDGVSHGVMVHSVNAGSPANLAGLVQFDVIVGINGKSINTAKEIYSIVEKLPFDGDLAPLTIDIIRRGKRLQVIVKPEVIEPYH